MKRSHFGMFLKVGMVGVVGTVILVATSASNASLRGPCFKGNCLDVWRPVICPNGQVYSNSCYAARACQSNCVPWGGDTE